MRNASLLGLRRPLGELRRWMFPRPEVKAWRHAVREASRVPRYTAESIRLLDYRIATETTPFSGRALCWAVLVRAFRP